MAIESTIQETFISRFKSKPRLFISPGRINLLGEHVDYNEGLVLPTAIDKHLSFAIAANDSGMFNCVAEDLGETLTFDLQNLKPGNHWFNYLMGVIAGMKSRGFDVNGFDCVFGGDIPQGAGLSSSAALCCGIGYSINKIFNYQIELSEIARIAQEAEHKFAGVNCGIMDQYACLFSEKGNILLLDCRTMTHKTIPLNLQDFEIVLVDSKVSHSLASTEYNDRRRACEEGVSIIKVHYPDVRSLRDVRLQQLNEVKEHMSEDVYRKCRYVISEVDRVIMATKFLNKNDLKSVGALMFQTHDGLSKEYEVSCRETDFLVQSARAVEGVAGARMMGGGFGGCTINLVKDGMVDDFEEKIRGLYNNAFGTEPSFHKVRPAEGVHEA